MVPVDIQNETAEHTPINCKYYCYIIANETDRTYNGYTTNLKRRLRQHNGELCGGARATHNRGPWRYIAIITSPGWISTSCAMKHEWSIKYPTRKRPRPKEFNGALGRLKSLKYALERMSPEGYPVICYIDPLYKKYVSDLCCPLYDFMKIHSLYQLTSKGFLE